MLDTHLAEHAHGELHERTVDASPEAVWQAIHEVTAGEFVVARALMTLRGLPARVLAKRDPLAAPRKMPFIEGFMRAGWCVLEDRPPEFFAAGAIAQPWRLRGGESIRVTSPEQFATFSEPGYVRMAMGFAVEPTGGGTRLRTETRVQPTDPASARAFARYWFVIRPPSGLIRHDLLRAIARRATRPDPS